MVAPARGDIWWIELDPVRGREQAGRRPALIISADTFNQGPRGLVWVLPMTRTRRPYPFHVEVRPEQSGLREPSYIMCEQLRAISTTRLLDAAPSGRVSAATLARVEYIMRTLLDL
jgi:mRNA interferase MazF